ncbi:uncharacterized protein DSM5745_06995 [Aspergillus mulundensis]|uniref:Subtelomeric hrmA-associated cluster protein AFUB-079030/YDR124W-like helical bundle domain-containing protein n=1 Tax=Aspergillus mulundensis TaxID=1810919 RepID=A0A3D8RJV8_9EURO|nr:Uncharacterized protein DSM5745_06995 [Aspergillus mulundensis]RDW74333.1 Uncharacterized protein DSM5745_06995 [Aspergillus mulundensis]
MVVNTPVCASGLPGGLKRPLSSLQDDCAGWASPMHMGAPLRPSLCLPFEHYALIYYDNTGKIEVEESPSIREQNRSVITHEVRERFRDMIGPKIGYQKPLLRRASAGSHAYGHAHDMAPPRLVKRRKASAQDHAPQLAFGERFPPEPVPQIPSPSSNHRVILKAGDTARITEFYKLAFENLQQVNCRYLGKEFIKDIEPKKQVNHPYKGNKKNGKRLSDEESDPELTKPDWWPQFGVPHKEPDHLKKEPRLRLLIHIIRKFSPDRLLMVANEHKRKLKPEDAFEDKMDIIREIFKVRKMEEKFERGEVAGDHGVYVRQYETPGKGSKDNESVISDTEPKREADDLDDAEDEPFTTASEADNLPSFASVNPLALQQPRPFGMSNDPFPLNESLSFQDPSRQARPYYTTAAEYADDYSPQSVLRPTATDLVGPEEHTEAFEYLNHTPFTTSAISEHQHRPLSMQQASHYETWTQFRPNLYNSMEYGASPTLAQNAMHYPIALGSSQAEIAHGLPDPSRDRPSSWASLNKSF